MHIGSEKKIPTYKWNSEKAHHKTTNKTGEKMMTKKTHNKEQTLIHNTQTILLNYIQL